jgi:hypothetical protein
VKNDYKEKSKKRTGITIKKIIDNPAISINKIQI